MRLSTILASALGFLMVDVGLAVSSDNKMRGATSVVSSNTTLASNDAPSQFILQTRSNYYSGGKYRGLKRAFPSRISPPGVRLFIFSPRHKAWGAYLPNGVLVGYGRASGGASWCRDVGRSCRTPRGSFRVFSKGSAACKSSRYPRPRGGAPMPYCMFFSKYYAIHGSPDVPNRNASHGCIRVKPKAARWLRNNFITIGTRVVVTSY